MQKFKRQKLIIKSLKKEIETNSASDTIKTKETENLSCITSETQSELIAMITACGIQKCGRSFYHICFYHPFTLLTLFFYPKITQKRDRNRLMYYYKKLVRIEANLFNCFPASRLKRFIPEEDEDDIQW